jgi:hypothetical protein
LRPCRADRHSAGDSAHGIGLGDSAAARAALAVQSVRPPAGVHRDAARHAPACDAPERETHRAGSRFSLGQPKKAQSTLPATQPHTTRTTASQSMRSRCWTTAMVKSLSWHNHKVHSLVRTTCRPLGLLKRVSTAPDAVSPAGSAPNASASTPARQAARPQPRDYRNSAAAPSLFQHEPVPRPAALSLATCETKALRRGAPRPPCRPAGVNPPPDEKSAASRRPPRLAQPSVCRRPRRPSCSPGVNGARAMSRYSRPRRRVWGCRAS